MQPNCLHDNPALTKSGHAAGWGAQALRSDPPLDCTCPGSYLPQRLGGQYCSQNFQAASASRGNIRAGCDVPIRRVVIEKYRLFATCRYREPSGRARFPAHWKSAVRKRGSATSNNTREPARSDKKKPQPRTVGVSLLVEVAGIEPASEGTPCPALHA